MAQHRGSFSASYPAVPGLNLLTDVNRTQFFSENLPFFKIGSMLVLLDFLGIRAFGVGLVVSD